jgi:hypothetical protein
LFAARHTANNLNLSRSKIARQVLLLDGTLACLGPLVNQAVGASSFRLEFAVEIVANASHQFLVGLLG